MSWKNDVRRGELAREFFFSELEDCTNPEKAAIERIIEGEEYKSKVEELARQMTSEAFQMTATVDRSLEVTKAKAKDAQLLRLFALKLTH